MENPFRYGEVATGVYFTDRSVELAELQADIRTGQNVVIISPRRFGKTSLVFQALELLKQEHVLVAYIDLFRTPTKDRFADHLADTIYSGLVAPFERVWQRAVDVFQKLPIRPKVTVNPDGTPSFEFAAGERSRDIERTIEGLLALPGQIASERKRRVALVLDEFQEVVAIDPHLPALMRAVFQFQGEVAHVFLGSKRHLMQRVFTDENEPMYKLAKPFPLREISAEDFAPFIRERFAATGQRIAEEAVRRVLATTDGHPHDTQELCYFTWSLAQAEGAEATPEVVDRALARVIEAEDARYTTVWEGLSPHQRLVLAALVVGAEAVYSEAYRRRHRLGAASAVQRSLERLVERELVEFSPRTGYRVPDVFLRAWIARVTAPNGGTGSRT
ncbi:MAG: ATP-binding protein [Chloroflexi bacterium]|nr:ATP-binding protein [Chloroflexota bacterium]